MAELSTADGSDTTSSEDGFSIGLPPVGGASHPVSLERNPQLDRDVGAVVTFFQAIRYGAQLDVPALVLGLRDQNAALHTELQKQRDEVARLQAEVSAQAAQLRAAEAAKSALSSDVTKLHAAVRGLTLRAQASWLPTRRSAVMLRAGASSPPLRGVHALSSGPHADLLVGGHSADSHFLQGPSGIAPLQLSASQADGSAPAASSGLAAGAVASVVGAVSSMSSSVTSSVSSLLRGGLPLQLPFGGQGQGQGQSSSSSVLADGHSSELALEGSPALPANAVPRSRSSRPSTGSASSSIASVASVASAPGSVSRQPPRPPTPSGPAGVSAGPGPGPAHRTSSTSSGHSAGAAAVSVVLPMSSWLGDSSHRHAADAGAAETAVAAVDDVVPGGSGSCEPLPSHTSQRESVESEADAPAAAHIASGGRQTAGRARTRRQLCAQCRQKLRRNPGGHDSAGSAEGTSTDDQDEAGVDDDRGDGYVGSERAGLSDSDELLLSDGDTGDEADGEPDNAALPPVGSEDAATATGRRSRGTTATGSGWPLPRPSFPRVPSPPFMLSRYGRAQVAGQAERSATATTSAPAALSRDDGSAPSALDAASASATSSFSPALASPSIISAATSAVANAGGALSDAIRRRLPSWGGAGSQPGAGAGPAADAPSREPPSSYGSAVASSTLGLNPLPVGRPPRPAAVPAVANAASARIAQAAASSSSSSSPGHSISTTAAAVAERDSHMPLLPADALYDSVQCEPLGPPAPAPPHDRDGDNHDAAAASHLPPVMAVEVPLSPQGGDAIGTVDTSAEPVHRRRTEGAGQSRHPRLPQGSRRRDHGRDGGHGTASASTDAWKHRFRHLTAGRGLEEATGAVLAELTRVMLSMEAAAAAAAAAASTRVPADATANASAAASAASSSCEAEGSGTAQRRQSKRPKLQADSEGSRDTQLLLSRCLALQLPLLALVQELADRSAFAGTPLAWHGGSERTLSQLQLSAHAQALLAGTDAPLATGATPSALSTAASALVAGSRAGAGAASAVPTQAGSADRTASGAAALSEKAPDEGGAAKASSLDVDADLDASAFVSPVPAFASPALASPPLQAGPSPISHFALAPALAPAPASAQSPSPSPSPWPAAIAAAAGGDSNSAAGSGSSSASTVAAATADPLSDSEERAVAAEGAEAVAEAEERAVAAEAAEAVAEAAEAEAAHELSPTELSELSAAPAAQEPQLVSAIALHALHDVETDVATDAGAGADAAAREEAGGDTQSGAARLAAFIADGGSPPFAPAAAGPSPSLSDVGSAGNCTSAVAHAEPSVPPASPQAAAQAPFLPLPPRILKRFPWLAAAMERASPEARATALAVLIRHAGFSAGGPVPAFDRVPRSVTHMPARPTAGQLASLLQPGIALPVPSLSHAPGPSAPLSPRRGLRILVLDGGGMRGLLELEILKRLEAEAGRPICDLFDLICGTSTGGMIAVSLACRKSLDEIAGQYEAIRGVLQGTSALVAELKRFTIGASHSTTAAESVLRHFFSVPAGVRPPGALVGQGQGQGQGDALAPRASAAGVSAAAAGAGGSIPPSPQPSESGRAAGSTGSSRARSVSPAAAAALAAGSSASAPSSPPASAVSASTVSAPAAAVSTAVASSGGAGASASAGAPSTASAGASGPVAASSTSGSSSSGSSSYIHMSDLPPSPKCFVLAANVDIWPPLPYLFRSYELSPDARHACQFVGTSNVFAYEAVRATSSAPTFYNPAVIGAGKFVDGAVLANSPVIIALCEAAVLWPGAHVDVVVSLGTGTVTPRAQVPSGVVSWAKTMLELATSSTFSNSLAAGLLGPNRYFRFDAPGGGDFDLTEMRLDQLAAMLALGRRYVSRLAADGAFARLCAALGVTPTSASASASAGHGGGTVAAHASHHDGAGAGAGAGARLAGSDSSHREGHSAAAGGHRATHPAASLALPKPASEHVSDTAALYSLGAVF